MWWWIMIIEKVQLIKSKKKQSTRGEGGGEGVKNFSKKYTKNTTVNPIDLNLIIYKN